MKILIAHNRYQQPGGEDRVVLAEMEMLSRHGHTVELLPFDNESIVGLAATISAAAHTLYSPASHRLAMKRLETFRPDVLHVHNFLPVMSPSIFFAAAATKTPVVQTLHNYRLLCANAQLYREQTICERCLESRSFLPGVKYACYRGSRLGSAVVGGTMALHGQLNTWSRRIHRYIALTSFAAGKLGQMRVPADRIVVKPNFTFDQGEGNGQGSFALFVGRLSTEKGIDTLIAADEASLLPLPIYIAGDGPMHDRVQRAASRDGTRIRMLGRQSPEQVLELMKHASVLLAPSLWYEGFPMVIVEALSVGLPVIASRIGGLPEIVEDGITGFFHDSGDAQSFFSALQRHCTLDPDAKTKMRKAARSHFLSQFSEEPNHAMLQRIYYEAIEVASS